MTERWGVFELELPAEGGDEVVFNKDGRRFVAGAFTDEQGVRRVRCMPDAEGGWRYPGGEFVCTSPEPGNHGPVRVAHETRFAYADGTPYWAFGSTKQRLEVLPGRLAETEAAVRRLLADGVEAELVLRVPHSDLPETVSRLAAFRNVWWCLPEVDAEAARLIQEHDYGHHLLSVHGPEGTDFGAPWQTHVSLRTDQVRLASVLTDHYGKPVVIDDCGLEGDRPDPRHSLTPQEMVVRVWEGVCRGGYVHHGTAYLDDSPGESAPRIAFLQELLAEAPADLAYDRDDHYASMVRKPGEFYLQYYGPHRFPERTFSLPEGAYRVEVIDTWNQTIEELPGTYSGEVTVELPGLLYYAARITRADRWQLADRTGERIATVAGTRLELTRSGDADPYLSTDLADLLVYSTNRPEVDLRLRFDELGLRIDATWRNASGQPISNLAVGLQLTLPEGAGEHVTIPGVVYDNNQAADPSRVVPKLDDGLVVEEHRLPIPGINAEWDGRYLSLLAEPAEGSLGAGLDDRLSLVAMSGVIRFNGEPDICYVHKGKTEPYSGGYLDLPTGGTLSRTYWLDWGRTPPGKGFRELVRMAHERFQPSGARPHSLDDIIRFKTVAMDARWTTAGGSAGYVKFPAPKPAATRRSRMNQDFLYGWTGQCLKLAWCDAKLGLLHDETDRVERCRQAVEFYLRGSGTGVAGLRLPTYDVEEKAWKPFRKDGVDFVSSRAYGETICDLIDIIALFGAHGLPVPEEWQRAVDEAADFFGSSAGMVPFGWTPAGEPSSDLMCAAGLPAVLALAKAGRTERAAELFANYRDVPFARSTLDAACEDKEAGIPYLQCALELYDRTGEIAYLEQARYAADWLLTWVYVWNPPYPKGSDLDVSGFSAVGWPTVSVQNHHLDVFFPIHEFARLGYVDLATTMLHAMGQGICTRPGEWRFDVVGEQGEAFSQTNWQHRGSVNTWNPSWVIAQVLSNTLQFTTMEVS
ncbi:DUF5605 domain-containing protein [Flindersiella endophytica]